MIEKYSDAKVHDYGYKFIIRRYHDGSGKIFVNENIEDDCGRTGNSLIEFASWGPSGRSELMVSLSSAIQPGSWKKEGLIKCLKEIIAELEIG